MEESKGLRRISEQVIGSQQAIVFTDSSSNGADGALLDDLPIGIRVIDSCRLAYKVWIASHSLHTHPVASFINNHPLNSHPLHFLSIHPPTRLLTLFAALTHTMIQFLRVDNDNDHDSLGQQFACLERSRTGQPTTPTPTNISHMPTLFSF